MDDETYLRINDEKEKCSHYYMDTIEGYEELSGKNLSVYETYLPKQVAHGDIIIIGEKKLRSLNIFFVNVIFTSSIDRKYFKRELVQSDPSQSGYCCVPLDVSKRLRDPLKYYQDAFNFNNYDEIDFSGIEIDPKVHEPLIKKFTNGKRVAYNRKLFYFLSNNDWDSSSGMFIWCDHILDDFDMGRYVKLTQNISELYLIERPLKCRDEQIKQASHEMKLKYENKFTSQFLTMLEGTEVEVYGITFFCPKTNNLVSTNCGTVLTMVFNRIELYNSPKLIKASGEDGSKLVRSIILNRLQIDNVTINEISKVLDFNEEFVFKRKCLTQYGRFGGVELWCIENAAIISNDDINTYVICSPDLFF